MGNIVLSLLVDNTSGVLSRVSGLFSRRGYNIDSVTVGETENPAYSRMTVAVSGDEASLIQIKKQLNKLEDVVDIFCSSPRISFLVSSISIPMNERSIVDTLLTYGLFSPIPAVNAIASRPPIAAAYAPIYFLTL